MKTANTHHLKSETIVYGGIIWSVVAAIAYLSFSIVERGTERPLWFTLVTTGIEQIALLGTGWLCWRNWRSRLIPSGRGAWLLFALAMAVFFIGNLCFTVWELWWGLDPAASIGNPWFVLFYLLTILGIRTAISKERVALGKSQWAIVLGASTFGIVMATWLMLATPQISPEISTGSLSTASTMANTQPLKISNDRISQSQTAPTWAIEIDRSMRPAIGTFNLFYVLCDVILLIYATILLLGFWGGHLGQPWSLVALAGLCFYIADLWFAYANTQISGYRSGFIMEVFWIFGIVQFGIAAALEFDNSLRTRLVARRRHAK
jgi:hypothetical protein